MAANISLTTAKKLKLACQAPTMLAMPIDTATEMLSMNASSMVVNMVTGIAGSLGNYSAVSSS